MSHYDEQRLEEEQALEGSAIPTTDSTLEERGLRYGDFANQAQLSQGLKNAVMQHYFTTHGGASATPLPTYMVEALSMILHKVARVVNGDPLYVDSWRDISAYAELVVRGLSTTEGATDSRVTTVTNKEGVWG